MTSAGSLEQVLRKYSLGVPSGSFVANLAVWVQPDAAQGCTRTTRVPSGRPWIYQLSSAYYAAFGVEGGKED